MQEKYRVMQIMEDDYGCEERSEDHEPQVLVVLRDSSGSETVLRQADTWLYAQKISDGDEVLLSAGKLKKQ